MLDRFSRTRMLLGSEAMEKLKNAKVCVLGLGGVGGYVVEALARSGVGELHIVDNDSVSVSNINRQIIATEKTVGMPKTELVKERVKSICIDTKVVCYPMFYLPGENELDFSRFDYVVDAIDTVSAKIDIAVKCEKLGVPLISSMGTGNKLDPTAFRVADIYKTKVCPLARVMRYELKKRNVKHLKVVYSEEVPREKVETKEGDRAPASVAFVPPVAGFVIASEVIKDISKVR